MIGLFLLIVLLLLFVFVVLLPYVRSLPLLKRMEPAVLPPPSTDHVDVEAPPPPPFPRYTVEGKRLDQSTVYVKGKLSIPSAVVVEQNMVVDGELDIGEQAFVKALVRAKVVRLRKNAVLVGSLFAKHATFEPESRFYGVLHVERLKVEGEAELSGSIAAKYWAVGESAKLRGRIIRL
mgnify:CR=1 FL=1